ncbi:ABC transporter permease [Singulisphaera acidiphila]|uniref:ABC-type antimicrobial peptide transport system, ATPase component n=1 Tax=Singulisphaera acidiphila (strain ATCC BAA-1392 / DSM 18658 / VKM B-2454 / MOB10) TaxID=886293 RepID=L0DP10_SINAD|nr:ABC transporter permease [Singulisphaera acidiphila]AGA31114.1 ABC-type antimicrobial peptide transport system, ATPase component [Singulisphaera acidiphila DSM 18658]
MTSLKLENIRKTYSRGKVSVPVLKGLSLTIERGDMVALMGSSGSGKTTLVNLLGSLDQPTSGRYWLDGIEVSSLSEKERAQLRNEKIGFVFQNFNLLPRLTALENVMMPLAYSASGLSDRECRERATALLERVGLGSRLDHEPAQLSGGEQQRVAIARSLVNRCTILIADEPTGNLDSKTGQEILDIFRELNEEDGLTIVLVTHDPGVAEHADRIIHMRDGNIVDDPRPAFDSGSVPAPSPNLGVGEATATRKKKPGILSEVRFFRRTTEMALRSLRRNVMRSVLTTLGIIIGVGSLISIAEIGKGSSTAIKQVLVTTGANSLLVQAGAASNNGVSLGSGTIKTLTPEDAEAITNECPAVDSLAPIVVARRQVVNGNRNWVPIYIYGTTPGFLRVREWERLAEGEAFTTDDVRDVSMVCVLGQTLVDELFSGESPLGKEVFVNDVPLRVIGVLSRKGTNIIGVDQDDILLAPWTTIKFRVSAASSPNVMPQASAPGGSDLVNQFSLLTRRYPRSQASLYPAQSESQKAATPKLERFANVDSILVRAQSTEEIPAAMAQITELIRERHQIGPGMEDDFDVRDFTEVIRAVQATVNLVAGLLVCAALTSLAVGGVGIMNIMLVSVTERFKEIGLRMAVGAAPRDILRQFLVEAVVLCVLGGTVGILAGRTGSFLIRVLAQWPTEPSLLAVIGSVSVSVTVGIIFGYYPAWKASRLNPIEALRYE